MDDFHVVSGHSKNTGASPRQTSLQNSTYLSPPPPTYSTLVIASFLHLGTRFQNWGPFFLVELLGHNWNPFIYSVIALGHLPSVHLILPQFCKEIFFFQVLHDISCFWLAGMLYLIQRETQTTLLAALFKVLILLISATPYDLNLPLCLCFLYLVCCIIDSKLDEQVCSHAKGFVPNCHNSHVQ